MSAMERIASFLKPESRPSSGWSNNERDEPLLSYSENERVKQPARGRLWTGISLYPKILIWMVISLVVASIVLFQAGDANAGAISVWLTTPKSSTSEAASAPQPADDENSNEAESDIEVDELSAKQDEEDQEKVKEALEKTPWLRFPHLNGYYNGLKTLVNISDHIAEYPNPDVKAPITLSPPNKPIPKPRPYNPYPTDGSIRKCYLDRDNKIPAPSLYVYEGVPQHMPDAALGSHSLMGLRDDVCFDRFGRYGPYGFGYKKVDGGSGVGLATENSGSEAVWVESGQINYNQIDWSEAQERCLSANKDHFLEPDPETEQLKLVEGKKSRTAVVIRLYTGFEWTQLAILNFRALITEVSLNSGGEYEVHFLLHVRDNDVPIWADEESRQQMIESSVPAEFRGLVTLWSEAQMRLFYPGKFDESVSNPGGTDLLGVYRSAHLPLQIFAVDHPEFEHFWNWEMDVRYLGNYYEFFDRVSRWAEKQPRPLLWERSARYFIPSHHGSWDDFVRMTKEDMVHSKKLPIFGPVNFKGKKPLRYDEDEKVPPLCGKNDDRALCGVGEAADIITLNPIFDVHGSGWVFSNDVTGYVKDPMPPRRSAIVTVSRMSRRLLLAMHEEVWRHHQTMFTEMFPPTVALHHGFKAVYAPHPIFLERAWTPLGSSIAEKFNGGQDHSTSGSGSPFHLYNEHNHKGTTWYYNSHFAGLLWRRWLGYPQLDGRGRISDKSDKGTLRGGKEEEESEAGSGRMCLRSMLVHPIKDEAEH